MSSTWKHIWLLWLCGVTAAGEFGKFAPLLTGLAHARGLSLPAAGWLSSTIELGGATGGLLIGHLVGRLGGRGAIQAGLTLLIVGGLAETLPAAPALWLGRTGESLGYLLVVVAAPGLMMQLTDDAERAHAMSLWSTFVPVGLAVGSVASATLISWIGLSGTLMAWALAPAVMILLTFNLPRTAAVDTSRRAARLHLPGAPVWYLCAAFFCCAALFVGVVGLLPTFLQTTVQASVPVSGAITGLAAFATVAGSAITSWRLRRDGSAFSAAAIRDLDLLGLALPALLLAGMYLAGHGTALKAVLAIVALGLSGIVPAILFARISDAGHRGGAHPAMVNGLLTHFGATGSLLGPPSLALLSLHAGWPAAAAFVVVLSLGVFGFATLAQGLPAKP